MRKPSSNESKERPECIEGGAAADYERRHLVLLYQGLVLSIIDMLW